jgi:ketosteroid isomerase-like protein
MMRAGTLRLGSYTVDSMRVRVYGAAAVVVYRSTLVGTLRGTDISSRRRRTTMLIKRDGRWLVVAQQSTPIIGG